MTRGKANVIIASQLHKVGYSCVEARIKRKHGENPSVQLTLLYLANRFDIKSLNESLGRHGTVFEALSQETCYTCRGSDDLVKGSFVPHRKQKITVRKENKADGFVWCAKKKIPDRDFLFFMQ